MVDGLIVSHKIPYFRLLALALAVGLSLLLASCQPDEIPTPSRTTVNPKDPRESLPISNPPELAPSEQGSNPWILLHAATNRTIFFLTQNGQKVEGQAPQAFEIPHLVLFRNGQLTEPLERQVTISVQGLDLPPHGLSITLTLETQHKSPPPEGGYWRPIPVWSQTFVLTQTNGITLPSEASLTVTYEFPASITSAVGAELTPTDYYRLNLTWQEIDAEVPGSTLSLDYALLLENQWNVSLPALVESVPGSAPRELDIFYCDMFLPWIDQAKTPLTRQRFFEILPAELIPQLVASLQVESNTWGFTWHPEWVSYRSEDAPNHLSIAFTDGKTWFHGMSSSAGTAEISVTLEGWVQNRSDTLLQSLVITFDHELFHNLQRDLSQHHAGQGEARGKDQAWEYFTEGTAVLASSIANSSVEFGPVTSWKGYLKFANQYLAGYYGTVKNLNLSISALEPRFAALYWRFIYEHCGGMNQGNEDQAAGMRVIHQILETLYSGQVVDINASTDLVGGLAEVMDRVLENSSCPFHSYAESLAAYARAVYSLRLQGGRCVSPGSPDFCQLYDPHHKYALPPAVELTYSGSAITFAAEDQPQLAGIPASFGMDFVEIRLAPETDRGSLHVELSGAESAVAVFSLQIILLKDGDHGAPPRQVGSEPVFTGILDGITSGKVLRFNHPQIDLSSFDRLGLIITRLDSYEAIDPVGAYTLTVYP